MSGGARRAWRMPPSAFRRLLPGFLGLFGCLAVLVSIGLLSFRQQALIRHERHWLRHSLDVVRGLDEIGIAVRDAETGQRGYLLTGRAEYLLPHDDAVRRLPGLQATLRRLTEGDFEEARLDVTLEALVAEKLAELAETIRLRDRFGEDEARELVLGGTGQHLMVRIVATLDHMLVREDALLARRRVALNRQIEVSNALSLAGTASGVAFLVFAARIVSRSVRRLRDSEAMFRLISEHAGDMIGRTDANGRLRYVSPSAERILGYPPSELLGATILPLVHREDRGGVALAINDLLAGHCEQHALAVRVRHADGTERWIETDRRLLRDPISGTVEGYVAISRDITDHHADKVELKRQSLDLAASNAELERLTEHLVEARDEADRANQAKSRFLASMSHELRTPLNAILGYAQLLSLDGHFDAVQSFRLEAMQAAGQHLLDMIDRVLTLSEIEASSVGLRTMDLDPGQEAERCLGMVRGIAGAKGLTLTVEVGSRTSERITCDPTRLRQILLNLLGNAVKFTDRGSVTLRLDAVAPAMLRFTVADTGPGVPAHVAHLLFQDFKRLHTTAISAEGAGLGLAISSRLASLMGGRLGYDERLSGGSLFWLELPTSDPPRHRPVRPPIPAVNRERALRVLVVDDASMNRDVAASLLRSAGHVAVCAENGEEAVEAVSRDEFDTVLMDVRMPGIDGLEATRRIRQLPGAKGAVRIVALTAQVFAEQVEHCRRAGMDAHLSKPFSRAALLGVLTHDDDAERPVVVDAEPALTVLDETAFDLVAATLSSDAIAEYLQILIERGEQLAHALRDRGPANLANLAAPAHTMSGSAGMFGFRALTEVARRFERACLASGVVPDELVVGLVKAIAAAVPEMRRLRSQALMANASDPGMPHEMFVDAP